MKAKISNGKMKKKQNKSIIWLKEKYASIPVPAQASFWYMFCSILQRGLSFIITPFFTRIMTLDEYGTVSLFYSWMVFVNIIATFAIPTGGFSKAMSKYSENRNRYTSTVLLFSSVVTILCCGIYFCIRAVAGDFLGLTSDLMLLMFVDIFFTTPLMLWTIQNRFEYKYKCVVGVTIISSILVVVCSVASVIYYPQNRVTARIGSTVAVHVIVYGIIMAFIFVKGKMTISYEYIKYSINYNLPLIPHYISQQVLIQSDRVMIDRLCNTADVAVYSLAYTFAVLIQIVVDAIHASFVPWSYQCMDENKFRNIKKRAIELEVIVGAFCLTISAIAPEIIYILGGERYLAAKHIIPPVSMSVLFILLYSMFANVEFYYEKTSYVMRASIIAAVVNIVLNLIFIPVFGFVAAGYTTLFSYFVYAIIHYYMMKRIIKLKEVEYPYNGVLMWGVAVLFVVLSISFSFLYEVVIARYIIWGIIIFCLFLGYRKGKKHDSDLLW